MPRHERELLESAEPRGRIMAMNIGSSALGGEPVAAAESPIFVIGSVRTGTTLVERILNRHSGIVVPPETFFFTFLDRAGLLDDDRASADDLRRLVKGYTEDRAFGFLDISPDDAEQVLLRGASSYRDVFVNLMEFLRERADKRRWGEKTPNNLRYVAHIQRYFPAARFVLVVRDGRAAVLSRLKHPVWRRNLLASARHWAEDAAVMNRLIAGMDDSALFVLRFEELLEDSEGVVRRLCAFLGEPYEASMLEPEGADSVGKKDYYRQPWMAKSTQGIDPQRATDWLNEYTPRRLRLVEAVAGEQLQKLGYRLVSPRAPLWQALYVREACEDVGRRIGNRISGRSRLPAAARPE